MNIGHTSSVTHNRLLVFIFCAVVICCAAPLVHAAESDSSPMGTTQNTSPIEQLHQSAQEGIAADQFELGLLFEYGRGVIQDDEQAAQWYEKSAAQGFAKAQYRLAVLLDNGWGYPVNKKKSFELYRSAAEKGHTLAQHDVAIMYFQGSGVRKDLVQAYKWLKIAELNGSPLMQKHLRRIKREMTPDEIREAEFFANQWAGQSGI